MPPPAVLRALTPGLMRIEQVPGQGRGVLAAKHIPYGTEVLREKPLVCISGFASQKEVCYHCCAVLPSQAVRHPRSGRPFCSEACCQEASHTYHDAEAAGDPCDLVTLCKQQGERFPLMVARLAFTQVTQSARSGGSSSSNSSGSGGPGAPPAAAPGASPRPTTTTAAAAAAAPAGAPTVLQGNPLRDITFLCYANTPKPYPEPWQAQYDALQPALQRAAAALGVEQGVDVDWYMSVLSRLHINSFRVDTVVMPMFGAGRGTLADMAAQAVLAAEAEESESPASSTPGTGGTGSAAYLVASLFNHSCEPNLDVVFPRNDATVALRAARDIEPGEQLSISYMDQGQPYAARQRHLRWAYGFACACALCREEGGAQRAA